MALPPLRLPLSARIPNESVAGQWDGWPPVEERRVADAALAGGKVLWLTGERRERERFANELVVGRTSGSSDRCLLYAAEPGAGDSVAGLIRLLVRVAALEPPDWSALLSDPESIVEVALDTADALDVWVHVQVPGGDRPLRRLARAAHRYGRLARWIFTASEAQPQDLPAELCVTIQRAPDPHRTALQALPFRNELEPAPREDDEDLTEVERQFGGCDALITRLWLEKRGGPLLAAGLAPAMNAHVARSEAAALPDWQLRLAVEAGDLEQLARIPALASGDPQVDWLESRRSFLLGRTVQALELAERAGATTSEPSLRRDSLLFATRLAMLCHDPARAGALLKGLVADLAGASPAHRAGAAALLAMAGERDVAEPLAWGVEVELNEAKRAPDGRTLDALVEAYIFIDDVTAGARVLDRWALGATRVLSPSLLYSGAFLRLQAGLLSEAADFTARLERFANPDNAWGRAVIYLGARRALAVGDLVAIRAEIDGLWQRSLVASDIFHAVLATHLDGRCARLFGSSSQLGAWPAELPAPAVRHRRSLAPEAEASVGTLTDRAAIAARLWEAEAAGARGARGAALAALDQVVATLDTRGLRLDRAEIAFTEGQIALICGVPARHARAVSVLEEASAWPSNRFLAEHSCLVELGKARPDFAALERLLESSGTSPVAARMAQTALGGLAPTRPLDQSLLAELALRWGPPPCCVRGPADRPGWGFDAGTQEVWRWDGPAVALAKAPLVERLVRVLLAHPAGIAKAKLAELVWDIDDYHPFRDDKRMQVAVRKLRWLIEVDPANPVRVVTTPSGYAIGATEPARCTDDQPQS